MSRALSKNEIEAAMEDTVFETLESQVAEKDRQENAEAARSHSWVNFRRPEPMTNDQLAALRTESQRLGRALTDAERAVVLKQ